MQPPVVPPGEVNSSGTVHAERVCAGVRAERVMSVVLVTMLLGFGAVPEVMLLLKDDSASAVRIVAAVATVVALAYGLWLWSGRSVQDRNGRHHSIWVDRVAVGGLLGTGLTLELLVKDVSVISGLGNPCFGGILASMYAAGVRLRLRSDLLLVAVAVAGHVVALRDRPIAGVEGAVNILLICGAARLGAREIRRAGEAQDQAFAAAEFIEREDGVARVHDGLGLLRVAMRARPSTELLLAARATSKRTDQWMSGQSDDVVTMASGVYAMAAQFPDLPLEIHLDALTESEAVVVAAVDRAVHTLLTNVRMHSEADHVAIVGRSADTWTVTITDDGRGFNSGSPNPAGGIERIARAALHSVGAELTVTSAVGGGTTAVIAGLSRPRRVDTDCRSASWWSRRFTSWQDRPMQGQQRVLWISDLGQLFMLGLPSCFLLIGAGYLRRHVQVPDVALTVAIVGVICLSLLWVAGPRPPRLPALVLSIGAFACGASVVSMEGADAIVGDKVGILLMLSAAVMISGGRPKFWPVGMAAAVVTLLILSRVDVASGVVTAVVMVVGSIAAALIVRSLLRFAAETEVDIRRVSNVERRLAGEVLQRQISAIQGMSAAAVEGQTRRRDSETLLWQHPAAVARQAEAYLYPHRSWLPDLVELLQAHTALEPQQGSDLPLRFGFSQGNFGSGDTGLLANFVQECAAVARQHSGKPVTVRGAYLPPSWVITVLLPGTAAKDVEPMIDLRSAELARSGLSMTASAVHHSLVVAIRPS